MISNNDLGPNVVARDDTTVTITCEYFSELCDDSLILDCLRNAGVDNWDGWDLAMEDYHEANSDD